MSATTIKLHEYILTDDTLPPEGEVVIVLNHNIEQLLRRRKNMWFYPDGSGYVYFTPKMWRKVEW